MIHLENEARIFSRRDALTLGVGAIVYASIGKEQKNRYEIPQDYLKLYQQYGGRDLWPILASIGKQESNHGQSRRAGVREGVNFSTCCVGPMQFNITNGPPSTWDEMGKSYQGKDKPDPTKKGNPYDPKDAIPCARDLLVSYGVKENAWAAINRYSGSMTGYADVVLKRAKIYKGLYPLQRTPHDKP